MGADIALARCIAVANPMPTRIIEVTRPYTLADMPRNTAPGRPAYSGRCIDLRNLHFSEFGLQIYRLTVRRSGSYDLRLQALVPLD